MIIAEFYGKYGYEHTLLKDFAEVLLSIASRYDVSDTHLYINLQILKKNMKASCSLLFIT